jgi:hypothetical protein
MLPLDIFWAAAPATRLSIPEGMRKRRLSSRTNDDEAVPGAPGAGARSAGQTSFGDGWVSGDNRARKERDRND